MKTENMEFVIGCNYWDSVSGIDMWKNWDPEIVDADLEALSKCGVKYLRIFPLWRDFQPVKKLYKFHTAFREYVIGDQEESLADNPYGMDWEMVQRFREFCAIADKYDMKLIVSIITGWMSGRLFVPPALDGKNLINDPEVLMWADKYIRGLIPAIKDIDNIVMWDLGNECNAMSPANSRGEAYTWAAFIRNSIYAQDTTRLISSGMHSLGAEENAIWTMEDQGDICDWLTTHPYPSATIGGDREPFNRMRTTMLPTVQSELYSSMSGKPCIIQETGTFCDTYGNEEMKADFLRVNVLSAWANNITGFLWWCGMELMEAKQAPYSWNMMERQLGMMDCNRQPKPVAKEMKRVGDIIAQLPEISEKETDAVCVLPRGAKWDRAAGSYILGKQAGFNVKMVNCDTILPDSKAYMIPCGDFWEYVNIDTWNFLLDKVTNEGANLLITYNNCPLVEFEKVFGLRSHGTLVSGKKHTAEFNFGTLEYVAKREILLESVGAEVLARNEEGNIVFARNKMGKGYIYFLGFELETYASSLVEGFNPEVTQPFYKIYKEFGSNLIDNYIVTSDNPFIGITQSKNEDGTYVVTAINYSDKMIEPNLCVKKGWTLEVLYGDTKQVGKCDAVVMLAKEETI